MTAGEVEREASLHLMLRQREGEIDELSARIAALREVLQDIGREKQHSKVIDGAGFEPGEYWRDVVFTYEKIARAALSQQGKGD